MEIEDKYYYWKEYFTIYIPMGTFKDSNPIISLRYEVYSENKGPLYPWLNFNAQNRTIIGHAIREGSFIVEVYAINYYEKSCIAKFKIIIVEDSRQKIADSKILIIFWLTFGCLCFFGLKTIYDIHIYRVMINELRKESFAQFKQLNTRIDNVTFPPNLILKTKYVYSEKYKPSN